MMFIKNKIYFIADFDPILNEDLLCINWLKNNFLDSQIVLGVYDNRDKYESFNKIKSILKFIFNFEVINFTKFENNEIIYCKEINFNFFKKLKPIYIKNQSKFELNKMDVINLKNYDKVDENIRNAFLINCAYFNQRVFENMNQKRIEHSINVGEMAYKLAIATKYFSPDKAKITGILHDVCKNWEKETMLNYLNKYGFKNLLDEPNPVLHSYVGGLHLKYDWLIDDEEIINAVFNHTVGRENMSILEKIIFCADKISIERDYQDVELFRNACFKNLNLGFKKILKNQYQFAGKKHGVKNISHQANKVIKFYLK